MDYLEKIIGEIEVHSVDGIKECFSHGVNPNDHFRNEPLIYELTSEYTRTPRFKDCVLFREREKLIQQEIIW